MSLPLHPDSGASALGRELHHRASGLHWGQGAVFTQTQKVALNRARARLEWQPKSSDAGFPLLLWAWSCPWATEKVPFIFPGDVRASLEASCVPPCLSLPMSLKTKQPQIGSLSLSSMGCREPGFGPRWRAEGSWGEPVSSSVPFHTALPRRGVGRIKQYVRGRWCYQVGPTGSEGRSWGGFAGMLKSCLRVGRVLPIPQGSSPSPPCPSPHIWTWAHLPQF